MCLVVLFAIANHYKSTQSLTASYKVIQKSYTSPSQAKPHLVSNPSARGHRRYPMFPPLVLYRRVKKLKWTYLHAEYEVNFIGNTFPKFAEPVSLQVVETSRLHSLRKNNFVSPSKQGRCNLRSGSRFSHYLWEVRDKGFYFYRKLFRWNRLTPLTRTGCILTGMSKSGY